MRPNKMFILVRGFINSLFNSQVHSNKYYTFHWAQFHKGQLVSQGNWFYLGTGSYTTGKILRQHIRALIGNESADITIQKIKEVSKNKYQLLAVQSFSVSPKI